MPGSATYRRPHLKQYGSIMSDAQGIATLAEGDGRDIQILFDPEGGFNGSPISVTTFTDILRITSEEISKEFIKLAAAYKGDLIHLYSKAFRIAPAGKAWGCGPRSLKRSRNSRRRWGKTVKRNWGSSTLRKLDATPAARAWVQTKRRQPV